MKEKVGYFLKYMHTITQEESDLILEITKWDSETKLAFKLAKDIFEDEIVKKK